MHSGYLVIVGGEYVSLFNARVFFIILIYHPLNNLTHKGNVDDDARGLQDAIPLRGVEGNSQLSNFPDERRATNHPGTLPAGNQCSEKPGEEYFHLQRIFLHQRKFFQPVIVAGFIV